MFSRPVRLLAALSPVASPPRPWGQAAAPKPKEGDQPVTVNGKPIPKSRVEFIAKQRAAQGQPDNDQARRMILDNLIHAGKWSRRRPSARASAKGADVRHTTRSDAPAIVVQALIRTI